MLCSLPHTSIVVMLGLYNNDNNIIKQFCILYCQCPPLLTFYALKKH